MSARRDDPVEGGMTLADGENELRLEVESYEFADARDEHDANWLVVAGEVRLGSSHWRFREACLLTWELEALMSFLWLAADDPTTPRDITFREPLLAFSWNGARRLRVSLDGEAKPDEQRGGEHFGPPVAIDFDCAPDDLLRVRSELELQRRRFPRRGN